MSSYITAGTRRLPDVEAIQHILDIQAGLDEEYNARQAIIAGFQGERKLLGVTLIDNFAPQAWKSLQPIYATLQNADFKQSHQDWYVVGQVTTKDSTVTLSESNHSQTSLRQAFSVTADNRFISFTIVDKDIHHAMNQAGDAFEVALLDAHTGQAITQIDGLTRSDSLLNIQADGTERVATGVKKVSNADGTSSYYIDLSDWYKAQSQAGKATDVMLSFDLLGFATVDSYVSLQDIGLSSRIGDRPSTTVPSHTTPSTTTPNTTDSNSTNPSTTIPSTTDSNSTNPSTTTPNTTDSNYTKPSTTTPSTTDSNNTKPSTTIPSTTDSNSTNPSTTDSNSTTPSSTTVNVLPPTKTPIKPVINLTSPNHIANQVVNTNFNKDTHINNASNSNNITNVSNTSNSHNITNVNNVTNTSNINPINPTNPTQDSTTTDLTDGDSWQAINPHPEQVNGVEFYQQGDIIDIAGQNYQLNAINAVSNGQRWLMLHDGLDINQQSKTYQLLGISKTIKTIAGLSYHK